MDCEDLSDSDIPSTPSALARRFPNPRSLFYYHTTKVKYRLHEDTWDDDDVREAAKTKVAAEWRSLDSESKDEWADLHRELLKGDDTYLCSLSASHLFLNGCARVVGRDGIGPSQRDRVERSPSICESESPGVYRKFKFKTTASDGDGELPPPLRKSPFKPVKHKYRTLEKPKRTVLIHLPLIRDFKPYQVADACRAAVGSVQLSVCEDAEIRPPGLCLVRFRRTNVARSIQTKPFQLGMDQLRALPYPTHPPQVFHANIHHFDIHGIRLDSVHVGIANAFPNVRFHILSYNNECQMRHHFVVAFERPVKTLCFSIGVQTIRGSDGQADFQPAGRVKCCPVCRRIHPVLNCGLLKAVHPWERSAAMEDWHYLSDVPKIL